MKVLRTNADHDFHANELARGADEVVISTYNIFAGISHDGRNAHKWGGRYRSTTQTILEVLPSNTRILVGKSTYSECKPSCADCFNKFRQGENRLNHTMALFPGFQWRLTTKHHFKLLAYRHGGTWAVITGGRNFSDSDWYDVSFLIDDQTVCHQLVAHFDEQWAKAHHIEAPIQINRGIPETCPACGRGEDGHSYSEWGRICKPKPVVT